MGYYLKRYTLYFLAKTQKYIIKDFKRFYKTNNYSTKHFQLINTPKTKVRVMMNPVYTRSYEKVRIKDETLNAKHI